MANIAWAMNPNFATFGLITEILEPLGRPITMFICYYVC